MRDVQRGAVLWLTPAALILGSLALATRPPATFGALVVTGLVGLVGAVGPLPALPSRSQDSDHTTRLRWVQAVGIGVAAFALARWWQASPLHTPIIPLTVAGDVLAAVAEELFFRRLMYGWLLTGGTSLAVGGAAAAFAAVHVAVYGVAVLPIDFAAGLLFGWQRWATGSWSASAVTHVVANLLQVR